MSGPWIKANWKWSNKRWQECAQVYVHWIGDTIQSSHPLPPSSPFLLQSFPASGSFPMSWLFASGALNSQASPSASSLPMNIQAWFTLGLTDLISLVSKGLARVLQDYNSKASILQHSVFFMVQLSYQYMTTGKTIALIIWTFVSRVMSLLFNMLSRLVIAFLPRIKCLLISRLQSPSAAILEPKIIKSVTVSIVSPSICHEVIEQDALILVFLIISWMRVGVNPWMKVYFATFPQ